jgi:hypothetical protein
MATVADLIKQLLEIKDETQTIVFQYYLAEDFLIDVDGLDVEPSQELFAEAIENVENYIWNGTWEDIASQVGRLQSEADSDGR